MSGAISRVGLRPMGGKRRSTILGLLKFDTRTKSKAWHAAPFCIKQRPPTPFDISQLHLVVALSLQGSGAYNQLVD